MKKLVLTLSLVGVVACSFAQGTINFVNTPATLISAGGVSAPGSATSQFNFAIFLAASDTVNGIGQSGPAIGTGSLFLTPNGANVNGTGAGRLANASSLATTGGFGPGSTVDFIVRGWSANAGATYAEALAFWNNGSPSANMYIGQSLVGNDLVLGGGAIGASGVMGAGAFQVGGFNLGLVPAVVVPEPSSLVLAGLGAASLLAFRRRN